MGQLKIIRTGPMATIQDFGRTGFRRYGIPQSGAIDRDWMIAANRQVGNPDHYPVIEFALGGLTLEAQDLTAVSVVGATLSVNNLQKEPGRQLIQKGDRLDLSVPKHVYAYLAIGGLLDAQDDFGSYATYERAQFGGLDGSSLKENDVLSTNGKWTDPKECSAEPRKTGEKTSIRIMKGPEWELLKELPESKVFEVHPDSDRMGIRLTGEKIAADFREIKSSAVVPGTIQLPPDGYPIILMNDCQTTGGYPRIGKVLNEDLGELAQLKAGTSISLN